MDRLEQELHVERDRPESDHGGTATIFVRNLSEAGTLQSRLKFWQLRYGQIRVAVPGMAEGEASKWSNRLTKDWTACGCEIAGLLTLLAMITCGLHLWSIKGVEVGQVFAAVGVVFASALVGKIVGLAIAYTRLHWKLGRLGQRIKLVTAQGRST